MLSKFLRPCLLALILCHSPFAIVGNRAEVVPTSYGQTADEIALRAVVEQFYSTYTKEDLPGFASLWSVRSPDLAARRKALEKLFADNDKIEVKSLTTRKAKVEGERANLRVEVELNAVEAKTGSPAKGFAKAQRSFSFVKEEGGWKIFTEGAAEEDFATLLAAAKNEAERAALMEEEKELLTEELTRVLYRQGTRFRMQAQFDEGRTRYQLSQTVSEKIGYPLGIAYAQIGMGNLYTAKSEYTEALEYLERGLKLSQQLGDKNGQSAALSAMGSIYEVLGEYAQALDTLQKSLSLIESLPDKRGLALTLNDIGAAHQALGDYTQALAFYQKSLTLVEATNDKIALAIILDSFGGLHLEQGNHAQAQEYFQKILQMSEASGHKLGIASSYTELAKVYRLQGDYDRSLAYFEKSLELKKENTQNKVSLALTLRELGFAHFLKNNYAKALECYEQSLALSESVKHIRGVIATLNQIATLKHLQGNYEQALAMSNRAAEAASQINERESFMYARLTAGKVHRALNQPAKARQSFAEAITEIEALRGKVAGSEQEQHSYFESRIEPFLAMVDLLVAENHSGEALLYAERAKARVLLDTLQSGRVNISEAMTVEEQQQEQKLNRQLRLLNAQIYRENLQPQIDQPRLQTLKADLQQARLNYENFQVKLYAAHPELKLRRGQTRLLQAEEIVGLIPDAKGALLEFLVTDDKTFLFVLTRRGEADKTVADLRAYTIAIKRGELGKRVEEFRKQLASRDLGFRNQGRALYDLLLKPAQFSLQGKTDLIIVPDGALWELPFQALQPAADHYFIEDASLSYVPSLAVLREMIRQRNKPSTASALRKSLLAFGNPALNGEMVARLKAVNRDEKLEPLPEAEKEVKALAELYGAARSKVYIGSEAREERVKAEAKEFSVLHFATHGILNNVNPMYSHLVLSQAEGKEDGLLEAWEIMKLDLKADMVVLSACETARGRLRAGEGVIGLTWAMFVAGSPTTVVSQWKVDSASTSQLMLDFYRALNSTSKTTKAGALRTAALKMLKRGPYRHPFYWAGFVMVGDGF